MMRWVLPPCRLQVLNPRPGRGYCLEAVPRLTSCHAAVVRLQVAEFVSQLRRVGKGLGVYEFDKQLAAVAAAGGA